MRKTILAVSSMAVLVVGLLSPPAAQAAANAYVVQGHPITTAPGLALIGDSCSTSGANPPTVNTFERDGGTLGTSALGWTVNQAGFEAGPTATLPGNPDTLNNFQLDVLAPTGTTGHAYARINWDNDTWYIGWASVAVPAGDWQHLDLVNKAYNWTYYDAGTVTPYTNPLTVQQLVTGPGFQAVSLGVLLGCGGQQFFVDRMAVANAENATSYDFEKAVVAPPPPPPECHEGHVTPECPGVVDHKHHMAHLEWLKTGTVAQVGNAVTLRYGESVWMLGHAHLHSDLNGDSWYSGDGTLSSRLTSGSSVTTESGAFGPSQYAAVKETPEKTTIYRFTAAAQDGFPAVTSTEVTVYVQAKVRAKVLDKHLVEGQKLAVRGNITPGTRRVKVTLQRNVGGRWTSVAATRTGAGGKFNLTTQARTPGSWKLRVKVNTTSSNLGTVTKSATVKVDRYVPPKAKPKQPPPPPTNDPTPEATAPVDTAEPTKLTAPIPTPGDRPTATGRTKASTGSTHAAAGTGAPGAKKS